MTEASCNGDGIGDADHLHEGGFARSGIVAELAVEVIAAGEDQAIGSEGDGVTVATSHSHSIGDADRLHEGGFARSGVVAKLTAIVEATCKHQTIGSEGDGVATATRNYRRVLPHSTLRKAHALVC